MEIVKWLCFILTCLDLVAYVSGKFKEVDSSTAGKRLGSAIGLIIGIFARAFVLYGAATCWLLN